jgi:hypothetical protein
MTYQYTSTEAEALALVAKARADGRRAYALCLNATTYEVRSWA